MGRGTEKACQSGGKPVPLSPPLAALPAPPLPAPPALHASACVRFRFRLEAVVLERGREPDCEERDRVTRSPLLVGTRVFHQ
jgi:hypothetical protein